MSREFVIATCWQWPQSKHSHALWYVVMCRGVLVNMLLCLVDNTPPTPGPMCRHVLCVHALGTSMFGRLYTTEGTGDVASTTQSPLQATWQCAYCGGTVSWQHVGWHRRDSGYTCNTRRADDCLEQHWPSNLSDHIHTWRYGDGYSSFSVWCLF